MLQPESIDRAFDYFRDASAPLVRAQAGSLGILGAGNRETGFGCAISFWETIDDLERSNANPQVVEAMGGYVQWMAGGFVVEAYSVASGSVADIEPERLRSGWMRTTTVASTPIRLDEILETYGERMTLARQKPTCVEALLLAPQIGSRVLMLEFWISRHALTAWDAESKLADQRLFRAGTVEQPPVRDTMELFGWY